MPGAERLLEHGALGAIVVFEGAIIVYLFAELRRINNRLFELLTKVDVVIQNGVTETTKQKTR